jgi:uncharacterized protein (TIGR00106 family)
MNAIADICVIPLNGQISVREPVARAHQILRDTGLSVHLHAYGTNIEGELSQVLAAIEKVHETLHAEGIPRLSTTIKLGTRTDKPTNMQAKVHAVQELL